MSLPVFFFFRRVLTFPDFESPGKAAALTVTSLPSSTGDEGDDFPFTPPAGRRADFFFIIASLV
jgi:hypothetical protein